MYVQQALDNNLPVPRACIAVSPWADVTCSAPSYTANAKSEIMMSVDQAHWYIAQCCGGKDKVKDFDLTHGDYSCYKGNFQGFCPLYVVAGAAELLASDAELVNQAALNAKVDSTLVLYPHMCHNFQVSSFASCAWVDILCFAVANRCIAALDSTLAELRWLLCYRHPRGHRQHG